MTRLSEIGGRLVVNNGKLVVDDCCCGCGSLCPDLDAAPTIQATLSGIIPYVDSFVDYSPAARPPCSAEIIFPQVAALNATYLLAPVELASGGCVWRSTTTIAAYDYFTTIPCSPFNLTVQITMFTLTGGTKFSVRLQFPGSIGLGNPPLGTTALSQDTATFLSADFGRQILCSDLASGVTLTPVAGYTPGSADLDGATLQLQSV